MPPLMLSEDRQLSSLSAEVLLTLAEAAERRTLRRRSARDLEKLDDAIVLALEGFREHRRREVLIAAAVRLPDASEKLRARLSDPNDYLAMAVRSVPDDWSLPVVRRHLLAWLTDDVLGRRAGAALQRMNTQEAWADVLMRAHLLLDPGRRKALRSMKMPARALPTLDMVDNMPPSAQAMYPRLIMAAGLPSQSRVEKLAQCSCLRNPLARLNALRALMGHRSEPAVEALRVFAADPVKTIARLAKSCLPSELESAPAVMLEVKNPVGADTIQAANTAVMIGRVMTGAST
ncbi:MAG TPA: hypothetical protein VG711_02250 [Phycisphaerales bacterium]|nr:hypothetical protein [Phycisphaerales bacterium]